MIAQYGLQEPGWRWVLEGLFISIYHPHAVCSPPSKETWIAWHVSFSSSHPSTLTTTWLWALPEYAYPPMCFLNPLIPNKTQTTSDFR
jgi:hypothetical protein